MVSMTRREDNQTITSSIVEGLLNKILESMASMISIEIIMEIIDPHNSMFFSKWPW